MSASIHTPRAVCAPLPDVPVPIPIRNTQVAVSCAADGALTMVIAPTAREGAGRVLMLPHGGDAVVTDHDDGHVPAVMAGECGTVYLGTAAGRLLALEVASGQMREVVSQPGESFTTGFRASSGVLYFGTAPHGLVVQYDPRTGAHHEYHCHCTRHDGPRRVCAFVELPDGHVAAFIDGDVLTVLRVDAEADDWERTELDWPATPACVEVLPDGGLLVVADDGTHFAVCDATLEARGPLPALPDGDAVHCMARVHGALLASGAPSGALYRWTPAGWVWLAMPMPYDPLTFAALPDGRITGLTYQGRLVQSTTDWRMFALAPTPTRAERGVAISALGVGPGRRLYMAYGGTMRVASWDPDADETSAPLVAAPGVGEVTAIGFAGERLLLGCAPSGTLASFHPDVPYKLLDNPQVLGALGPGNWRPIGPMVHHHSNVYVAANGPEGGAMVRLEPGEGRISATPAVLPGGHITSLVVERLSDCFVLGTHGPDAALWSPATEAVDAVVPLFPDAAITRAWAAEGGRVYLTDGGARYAVLDTATRTVLESGEFALGPITALINTLHGELYGLAAGWFFHWRPREGRIEQLVEAEGEFLTEVRRNLFAFAKDGQVFTVRVY
jgi:hypothetical protein